MSRMDMFMRLRPEQIHVVPGANPRKRFDEDALAELTESIRQHGIIEPLVVRPMEDPSGRGYLAPYELIAGERRFRAAQRAGLERLPVIVKHVDAKTAAEMRLVENLQRRDLDAIEEALAFRALIDEHGWTQEQLGERVGKSQEFVANRLRLLELPDDVQESISRGILSPSAGRELLRLREHPDDLREVASIAIEYAYSTRSVENAVRNRLEHIQWKQEMERQQQERAAQSDPEEEARREAEREEQARRWAEQRRREQFEKARADAIVAAAVDHLAPEASDPTLWAAALVTQLGSYSGNAGGTTRAWLYKTAGVEPSDPRVISNEWATVPQQDFDRLVRGLAATAPLPELRKRVLRIVLSNYVAMSTAGALYDVLPEKARARVDERVERARKKIYGESETATESTPESDDEETVSGPICSACGVQPAAHHNCGCCEDCCPCEGPEALELEACIICGCTEAAACPEGCFWVADDLCSACIPRLSDDDLRRRLANEMGLTLAGRELMMAEAERRGLQIGTEADDEAVA